MTRRFAIAFDYLCPFARNANEHVIAGLRGGADWDVDFVPYSLAQGHVEEGAPAVWERDDPHAVSGVLALQAGLAVRDMQPACFLNVHAALFAARHDRGEDLRNLEVVRAALERGGADAAAALTAIEDGTALEVLRREHQQAVADHEVWGVPTFIAGERAVFVRLMDRPDGDHELGRTTIDRVIDLVEGVPSLHEFKQTTLTA